VLNDPNYIYFWTSKFKIKMYPISHIIKVIEGQATLSARDSQIEHLLIDSRKISFPESSLFFAIVGARHDGHDFIEDVYKSGVRYFVVSQDIDNQFFTDAIFINVNDVLRALQDLAAYHRSQFPKLKVIGITGSNGKTVVKEWLYQLLKDDYNIVRSPKSYNSQVGVPLSVWQIRPEHTLAIFEAGISQKGEMEKLERIIQPRIGILTNIGSAHDEGFASREEKLSEKLILFNKCGRIYYKRDDNLIDSALKSFPLGVKRAWGQAREATLTIKEFHFQADDCIIEAIYRNKVFGVSLTVPFKDVVSLENIIHCWNVLLNFNVENNIINKRVKKLEPVAMRLELKAGINGCLIVDDAYNFDLNALQIALDFVNQQSRHLKKTVVLSDMLQSGKNMERSDIPNPFGTEGIYETISQLLVEKKIERVIGIGEDVLKLKNILPQNIDFQHFTSTKYFLSQIKNTDFHNEIILLKGARPFAFEQITNRLALKAHKTVLEINLNALVHNLHVFTQKLKPNVKIMAMVKASAYGNGSDEVARLLEFHKVDYLAVAYADEGIDLRNAGVKLPIMVMNPEEASFDALRRFDLEPEIYSLSLLKNYIDFVEKIQLESQNTEGVSVFKIHLKLDTGMHRLGLEPLDIQQVISFLNQNNKIRIASIFTHLAATEAAEHDGFTQQQVARFETIYAQITEGVGYKPMRHVLNSSGIARHPHFQFEMVRLGIGLYGIDGSGDFQQSLQVVQTLKATISQIRNVPKTETVGYSRRGLLARDARIATISIGYADGLLRGAGYGRFSVALHGKLAPIVGSVCMDMTMIDVTDIPEAMEGDDVEIFGSQIPVQTLANVLNTIPYEIFTTISERVKRVYFQE
jgi:Alr-MurF fusion protein